MAIKNPYLALILFTSLLTTIGFSYAEEHPESSRPQTPQSLEVLDTSSRSVRLSWKVLQYSTISRFIVEYKVRKSNWEQGIERIMVLGEHKIAPILDLHPATYYDFRIVAKNDAGDYSDPSDTVTIKTDEEAPSGPPRDLVVEAVDQHSLSVSWRPLKKKDANGVILGYYVGYKLANSNKNYKYDTVEDSNHIISNLDVNTEYAVVVQAYTKIGQGPRTDEIRSRTEEGTPFKPPQDVTCEVPEVHRFLEASSSTVTFHLNAWSNDGCQINYFSIEYKIRQQFDWITASNQMRPSGNYVIMELNPATWYNFRITAHNNAGSTVAEYEAATLTLTGATVPPYDIKIEDGAAYYTMGEHTLKIPMTLHRENRERLVKRLQARGGYAPGSVVLLQGGENTYRSGSGDVNDVFRQESYFHWAFGVLEPGWFGAIDVSTGKTSLFMPRLPQEYAMWMGHIRTPDEFERQYEVYGVHYVDEMGLVLTGMTSGELLTLHGINSDSGRSTLEATFDGINNFTVNKKILHDEIAECRVHKTETEIMVMRYAASVSCAAHREVMRKIRPGMKEYQLESMFQHHTYYNGGCRHHAYTNICGSGPSAAILHYGHAGAPNDRTIRNGDTIMLDMGAEYYGYASDVSVSYPASGKFSDDHKNIYNSVLAAYQAVAAALRPGVSWIEMQRVAYRAMLEKLKEAGLVHGIVDKMMIENIGSIFFPHGLGHLLGIDVHDVGGYLDGHPSRPTQAGYRKLRTARIIEENMVLTIEPGCYFIDHLLDEALANPKQAQFLVSDEIERFRGFGGVRIEDDVLVTVDGIENLSHELPRTVEDIEALMAAGRRQESECGLY